MVTLGQETFPRYVCGGNVCLFPAMLLTYNRCVVARIYLGFYIAFNTLQVISRRVVGRAEETST